MAIRSINKSDGASVPFVQESALMHLPAELIQKILCQVHDIGAILACGQTCKAWNIHMRKDPVAFQCFWKCLLERDFGSEAAPNANGDFQRIYKKKHGLHSNIVQGTCATQVLSLPIPSGGIKLIAFVDGKLVLTNWEDNGSKIRVWDVAKNTCLYEIKEGATDNLIYAEGKLIGGSEDISVWNFKTGACLQTLEGHKDVKCLLFADGKLFSGSADRTIKVWDLETYQCLQTLEGHSSGVTTLSFAKNKLFSGSYDGEIKVWDIKTGMCQATLGAQEYGVSNLVRVGDQCLISLCQDSAEVMVWDIETNAYISSFTEGAVATFVCAEGNLISRSRDKITVWDLETWEHGHIFDERETFDLTFGEGKLFSSCGSEIKIWDFNPKQTTVDLSVRFDAKWGNSLVLCGEGGDLSWDPSQGKPLECVGGDRWTIQVPDDVTAFKLVWKKKDGSYVWEKGSNRTLDQTESMNIEQIQFSKRKK